MYALVLQFYGLAQFIFFFLFPITSADSAGLSMQTLTPSFRRIPRAIFTVLAFIIYTVAGVAGRQHFSPILSNFLAIVCISFCLCNPVSLICVSVQAGILDCVLDSDSSGRTLHFSSTRWCTRRVWLGCLWFTGAVSVYLFFPAPHYYNIVIVAYRSDSRPCMSPHHCVLYHVDYISGFIVALQVFAA